MVVVRRLRVRQLQVFQVNVPLRGRVVVRADVGRREQPALDPDQCLRWRA